MTCATLVAVGALLARPRDALGSIEGASYVSGKSFVWPAGRKGEGTPRRRIRRAHDDAATIGG